MVATAVGESYNLVLLSVTVEAIWFAKVLSVACCVTRLDVSLTCHAVSRILRDFLRDRLHCISGLSDGHKCLLG